MRIGIDARFVGPEGTGLGKYAEKLIENLQDVDNKNNYVIFLKANNFNHLKIRNKNFSKVLADVNWYSVDEQIKMPAIFASQKLDILHVPHFNVPFFYKGKFVVTIHDLIHHDFSQESATTKNYLIFKVKRLGYQFVINNAIKKSVKVITPSNFVKEEIIKVFRTDPAKIVVTYEAAEEEYFSQQSAINDRYSTIIYVGNAYPHKNLSRLLDAMVVLTKSSKFRISNLKLVLVCPRDVFWQRLKGEIKSRNLEKIVELSGYLPTDKLGVLFKKAKAYVSSSLSEGFGIPGLNAMAAGIPVICSNIPTFREIYGEAAIYFNPENPNDIAREIKRILKDTKLRTSLIKKETGQVKKYSWRRMAWETLKAYEKSI